MRETIDPKEVLKLVITNGIPSKYSVHCETTHDATVLAQQIPDTIDVAYECISGLAAIVSTWKGDYRGSAASCADASEKGIITVMTDVMWELPTETLKKIESKVSDIIREREED